MQATLRPAPRPIARLSAVSASAASPRLTTTTPLRHPCLRPASPGFRPSAGRPGATPRPPSASSSGPARRSTTGPPYLLVSALASAGAAETAYLAWAKLSGGIVVCPLDGGCDAVLGSPYAEVFGLPLPVLGCAAYASVAALAAYHWRAGVGAAGEEGPPSTPPHPLASAALAAGAAALATTSASLLALLATRLAGAPPCPWCLTSAGLSLSIAALLFASLPPSGLKAALAPGGSAALATLLALQLAWAGVDPSSALAATSASLPFDEPAITRPSPPGAVDLARRLRAAGARMYGAFWCGHCFDQRQAFGAAAASDLPYVECYPSGVAAGGGTGPAPTCTAAGIQGFPSWVLPGGEVLEGEQSFEALEAALKRGVAKAALDRVLPTAPALVGR